MQISLSEILEGLLEFAPQVNSPSEILSAAGNYIVVLNDGCSLPAAGDDVVMERYKGRRVIYTGSSTNLKNRIGHDHLKGHSSFSTFRISLGCLLGFKQLHRDRIPDHKHYRFSSEDEAALSIWIRSNLLFYYKETSSPKDIETALIESLNPPMNLDGNEAPINSEFRAMLKKLRSEKPV